MEAPKISHTKSSVKVETNLNSAVVEVSQVKSARATQVLFRPPVEAATIRKHASTAKTVDPRRQKIEGKKILFVCVGHDGLDSKKFTCLRAKELGIRPFVLEDPNNSLAITLEKEGVVEQLLKVDMRPRPSLVADVMEEILRVQSDIGAFDGVCTFWDDAVSLCARVCERLGLPGCPVKAIDIAHDKHLTRQCMREAGLPTPKSALLKCEADLAEAAALVGVPAILKPMYGASSLAVLKVEKLEDVLPTYKRVVHLLDEFYAEGELMGLTFDESEAVKPAPEETGRSSNAFTNPSLLYVVMEQFLDGEEVDVDVLLNNGEVTYQCVVDDWPQIEPWFAEMGNNCPSVLPQALQEDLAAMAVATVRGMGFTDGLFHVELKNTSEGPRLIEVNPRMGGGPVWRLHKMAFGVDFVEEQIYASVGAPITPNVPTKPKRCVSCGEKFFEKSFKVPKEFCDVVRAMSYFPNVVEATPLVEPGESIIGIQDGFPTRTARFVVLADSPLEAWDYAQKLLDMCDIPDVVRSQKL